ncbi:PREDICTED: uncharacterized protein LOC109156035 [Ipomoea nil]|uniref:uncharacterized protein LOC109156035 n=1 Tax=Ipomoea nil TaxID=35883 RepID=UPI0009016210|nr:PREDICTED: uncharacterized protein LOC109156035 [Ipomoea nil]
MQSPCIYACKSFNELQLAGFQSHVSPSTSFSARRPNCFYPRISCSFGPEKERERGVRSGESMSREKVKVKGKGKGKDNVWSIDSEMTKSEKDKEKTRRKKKRGNGRRMTRNTVQKSRCGRVMVSGVMLIETETVLQTQEPVIRPVWSTFASSVSGIWKGVGAVFSPVTAEMEPIEVGNKNEYLFDCYTLSRVEAVPPQAGGRTSQIQRTINWVSLNPYGEVQELKEGDYGNQVKGTDGERSLSTRKTAEGTLTKHNLPKFESFDFGKSDVMEEDIMGTEPGLVFFEDGSYSRGPVDIPVGGIDDSKYYLSPTFKFEQCLVKGCHKRLRMVHTIEFSNGGSDIQILRVAAYEEQWVSPANILDQSDLDLEVKPFSQRRRVQPVELTGSWKVFEMSVTPVYGEENDTDINSVPVVYLCMETLNKRGLPETPVYFGEEDMLDMQDATILWLPGGVTSYVDVKKDGILCIGVGWYSDEGINLVMERDYGTDGKLKEVRWKSEMKRRWTNPPPM